MVYHQIKITDQQGLCKEKKVIYNANEMNISHPLPFRVRNLKFATYLKFATCENTNKINELW